MTSPLRKRKPRNTARDLAYTLIVISILGILAVIIFALM